MTAEKSNLSTVRVSLFTPALTSIGLNSSSSTSSPSRAEMISFATQLSSIKYLKTTSYIGLAMRILVLPFVLQPDYGPRIKERQK